MSQEDDEQNPSKIQNGWSMCDLVIWRLEGWHYGRKFGGGGLDSVSSIRIITMPKLTVKVVFPSVTFKIFSGSRDSIEKKKKGFCMENQTRKKG